MRFTVWGHSSDRIGIWKCLVFEERGKPEYQEKNQLEEGREPTTNSNHIAAVERHVFGISEMFEFCICYSILISW